MKPRAQAGARARISRRIARLTRFAPEAADWSNQLGHPAPSVSNWSSYLSSAGRSCLAQQSPVTWSSVAFAHDEVQTAQHRRHIAHHATGQKLRQDTKVHKRWRANFQPIRHAAASAVDIKTKLALGIFCCEINFARWRIEPFSNHDEMMDQLFHLCHAARFRRSRIFPVCDVDRSTWKFIDHLPQDPDALAHLLDPYQIPIITIARAADHHVEIIFVVIEV